MPKNQVPSELHDNQDLVTVTQSDDVVTVTKTSDGSFYGSYMGDDAINADGSYECPVIIDINTGEASAVGATILATADNGSYTEYSATVDATRAEKYSEIYGVGAGHVLYPFNVSDVELRGNPTVTITLNGKTTTLSIDYVPYS